MVNENGVPPIFKSVTYKHIIPVIAIGFVVMVVVLLGITKYSTAKPDFCLSCHHWQAYSDFLEKSEVHPNIDCAECHADHGQFIPTDYEAEASRVEPNCLRCHDDISDKEEMTYKYNEWNITIPHKMHIQDIEAKCTDCHMNIMHDRHSPHTNRPQMETCFNCHDPLEMPCSACHPKDSVELPTFDVVARSNCRTCHPNFVKKSLNWNGYELTHAGHVKKGINCNHCHSNAQKHGTILLDGKTGCSECHDDPK